jgi:hypothetical protein
MNLRGVALLLVSFPSLKHVNNITSFPKPLGHIRGRRRSGPERLMDAIKTVVHREQRD